MNVNIPNSKLEESVVLPVLDLVKEAGSRALEIYRSSFSVEYKADNSPITEADIAVNKMLVDGLEQYGWPILSEELADSRERIGVPRVWIIDPVDGTKGFIDKEGDFSIMVGLAQEGHPIFGVVYQPTENKLYYAQKGKGSYLVAGTQKKRLKVSDVSDVSDSRLVISRNHFSKEMKEQVEAIKPKKVVHIGSTGLKAALIAEEKADFFFSPTPHMGQWDLCAPHIILEEAGGKMTGICGQELVYNKEDVKNPYGVLATNGKLHKQILEYFHDFD